ncbi:MAG: uncharacterized protein H6Q37_1200 [Chloroflexi bacterium]|nr:uncharacterized protein [Chloroflexota bacterium]
MNLLAFFIDWLIRLVMLVVIIDVLLTYFMSPAHPVRRFLDRLVEPMLAPIRRVLPSTSPVDLSPIVLVLGLILINQLLQTLLRQF